MAPFSALNCTKTLATHVGVGMCAASFWRGAWYLLDDHLYPDDAAKSAMASLGLGVGGMAASQGLVARAEQMATLKRVGRIPLATARFGAIYTVALSCVLVWRGTWVGWDCIYERLVVNAEENNKATDPGHATHSGLLSKGFAVTALLATGLFASVLAPPAAVSVIRDLTVKSGQRAAYRAPAQSIVNQMFGSRSMSTTPLRRRLPARFRK
eukprot:CAMPEP_0168806552 /NCGR_PEP_ID=MMETSP0726-20121227/1604_1 /TAXON_ID=265536 /ORGANISM="Amphiprora sp., Strain CCMP467" /LENGTH=210 /DNA_ID=CAMNT_0008858459 /DNA_START=70 /DNA_END=702 /DNA_ORIENTATION=+